MQTEQRRYLASLENSSVLAKRALQIEHRRCLGSLARRSVRIQRALQKEQRRYLERLESSTLLTKRALLIEQSRCLGSLGSSSVPTQMSDADIAERISFQALGAAQYSAKECCRYPPKCSVRKLLTLLGRFLNIFEKYVKNYF